MKPYEILKAILNGLFIAALVVGSTSLLSEQDKLVVRELKAINMKLTKEIAERQAFVTYVAACREQFLEDQDINFGNDLFIPTVFREKCVKAAWMALGIFKEVEGN